MHRPPDGKSRFEALAGRICESAKIPAFRPLAACCRRVLFATVLVFFSILPDSKADSYLQANISLSDCGDVDQYASTIYNRYAGEACVPTSQANALIYLQNAQPAILGSSLTDGTAYSNFLSTVLNLGSDDDTTISNGTYYIAGATGLHSYLSSAAPALTIGQSACYSTDLYGSYGSVPGYISFQDTSANLIYTALLDDDALYLGLSYSNTVGALSSGGHSILVEGIDWDSNLDTGTLSFIDPLDPGANSTSTSGGYENGVAISPVITTGTIQLDPGNSNLLLMSYDQFEGGSYANGVPPSSHYSTVHTVIGSSETLSVAPEPSTWEMLLAGAGLSVGFWKRRRSWKPEAPAGRR